MALATYTIPALAVTFASGKSMLAVMNPAASGKTVKIWRIWFLNNQTTAVTGVLTWLELRRASAVTSGTAVTPVQHSTATAALNATVVTNGTVTDTASGLLRQVYWSNDEPAVSGASQDEAEVLVPMNQVWDAGYGDTNVAPLTLAAGEGFHVKHGGTSAVGTIDIFMEVTEE